MPPLTHYITIYNYKKTRKSTLQYFLGFEKQFVPGISLEIMKNEISLT